MLYVMTMNSYRFLIEEIHANQALVDQRTKTMEIWLEGWGRDNVSFNLERGGNLLISLLKSQIAYTSREGKGLEEQQDA